MSSPSLFGRRGNLPPTVPRGDVLGTYDTYAEAQKVVDRLAKAEFEVKKLAIVGHDLTIVERVTGRLTYGRVALGGSATGAWFGLFLGLVLFLFSPDQQFSVLAAAALIGAGLGMLFAIVSYAINRKRRDYTSTNQVLALSYQIIIDPGLTGRARQVLGGLPSTDEPAGPATESTPATPAAPESAAPGSTVPDKATPDHAAPESSSPADSDPPPPRP